MTRKRKRDEELSVDFAIEASESRETPTTTSNPASKATTEVPEGDEVEIIPDSEPSSPKMGQTQTDETTKPEEQEVEIQLCAEVSSVSLDEHEQGPGSRNDEQGGSVHMFPMDVECVEIDNSPPNSPMVVDREVHIEDLTGESTPHGTVEPSAVETEDANLEVPPDPGAIDPGSFYGTAVVPFRTYGNKKPRVPVPAKLEGDPHGGDLSGVEIAPLKT